MPTFEDTYGVELRQNWPCSVLSGLPVFRPDSEDHDLMGFEIDHLLHVRDGGLDTLIIVECKGCPIRGPHGPHPQSGQPWIVDYLDRRTGERREKNARQQVINHAVALIHFFEGCRSGGRPLVIEACVVSKFEDTPDLDDIVNQQVNLRLRSATSFKTLLANRKVLRIEQSALLSELRLGQKDSDVGHPPINDSIRFICRSRNALDLGLYDRFTPTKGYWAVNGSAGMGKSALLAYTLFVVATDQRVVADQSDFAVLSRRLENFESKAKELGLPPLMDRAIQAVALKQKQVDVLRSFWERYRREFSALGSSAELRFNEPSFSRWEGVTPESCNVLLIDEAHDLDDASQDRIASWLRETDDEHPRFLVIACDRHQKLRLVGPGATLIKGVNFGGHTRRLNRNYRNPFPVFCAGLAVMFRWFASSGPKILPTKDELKDGFGFRIDRHTRDEKGLVALKLRNDSHPANHWLFTATIHESAADAYAQLSEERLGRQDVLWVRFSREDPLFIYENLQDFTYHNCSTEEATELVDKYVKGQEYPVVVIEGVPSVLSRWEERRSWAANGMDEQEGEMWKARRLLYLCASRSTAFLIFVVGEAQGVGSSIRAEIESIIRQIGQPSKMEAAGSEWTLSFSVSHPLRPMDAFDQDTEACAITPAQKSIVFATFSHLTVEAIAKELGVAINRLLLDLRGLAGPSPLAFAPSTVVPFQMAQELAQKYDCSIVVQDTGHKPAEIPLIKFQTKNEIVGTTLPRNTVELPNRPTIREIAQKLGCQPSEVLPDVSNIHSRVDNLKVIEILKRRGLAARFVEESGARPSIESSSGALPIAATALLNLTQDRNFRMSKAIDRYIAILQILLKFDARAELAMVRYRTSGHRVHFARSKSEIESSGSSTKPRLIPGTNIYVATNVGRDRMRPNIHDLLTELGYNLDVRMAVRDWLVGQ